jgi:hypothetical protein
MPLGCNSNTIAVNAYRSRRAQFAVLAWTLVASCAMLGSGCSRLAGDHEVEEVDEQEVTMEELMNESKDSSKPKRAKAVNKQPIISNQVVADDTSRKSAAADKTPSASTVARERAAAAKSVSTNPFTKARRAGLNKSSRVPVVDKSDEIPDAADVGL